MYCVQSVIRAFAVWQCYVMLTLSVQLGSHNAATNIRFFEFRPIYLKGVL